MKLTVKEKTYNLEYTSVIGVNYTYETEFGSTIFEDTQKMSDSSVHVRIAWAILKTDNDVVDCTFDEFRKSIDDKEWLKVFTFIGQRTSALKPALEPNEGGEQKNA